MVSSITRIIILYHLNCKPSLLPVVLDLHLQKTKLIVLFLRPLIGLNFQFGIFLRGEWVVNEAIVRRVVQDQGKRSVPLLQLLELA